MGEHGFPVTIIGLIITVMLDWMTHLRNTLSHQDYPHIIMNEMVERFFIGAENQVDKLLNFINLLQNLLKKKICKSSVGISFGSCT